MSGFDTEIVNFGKKLLKNPLTWIFGLFLLLVAWPLAMVKVILVIVIVGVTAFLAFLKGKKGNSDVETSTKRQNMSDD